MKLRILFAFLIIILISNGQSKPKKDSIGWGRYFGHSLKWAGIGFLGGTIVGAAAGSSSGNGDLAGVGTTIGFAEFASFGTIIGSSIGAGIVAKNKFFTPMAIMAIELTPTILLINKGRADIALYVGFSSIFITPTLAKLFDKVPANPPVKPHQRQRKMTLVPIVAPVRRTYGFSLNVRF